MSSAVPPIESLLKLAAAQGANELRVGTDKAPAMFQGGAQKPLTLRPTNEAEIRYLLGALLSDERELLLRRDGQLEFSHFVASVGTFMVTLTRRGILAKEGPLLFDGVFLNGTRGERAGGPHPPSPLSPPDGAARGSPPPLPSPPSWGGSVEGEAPGASTSLRASAAAHPSPSASPRSSTPTSTSTPTSASTSASAFTSASTPTSASASTSTSASASPFAPLAGISGEGPGVRTYAEGPGVRDAPAPLASMLAMARELRASDLHLLSGQEPYLRVDGRLKPLGGDPVEQVGPLVAPLLDEEDRGRIARGCSVDLATAVPGVGRFRLNVYPTSQGLALAARMLASDPPSLSSLNLPFALDDLADLPGGLVIVTGPTGAGKSTTLAALALEALRRRSIMLLTLEDPIEYAFPAVLKGSLVRQRQIGHHASSFAEGLRGALREDPDVILIGEMRDPESISLALTAAETGHLVLTSLHSRSAASAVERIVDTYAPERQRQIRVQLADALRAVVAQRLLPRARGGGRLPAVEVLRGTHAAANLIREGKTEQLPTVIQSSRHEGMVMLERCLVDLVRSGQVTAEHARAASNDPSALAEYLRGLPSRRDQYRREGPAEHRRHPAPPLPPGCGVRQGWGAPPLPALPASGMSMSRQGWGWPPLPPPPPLPPSPASGGKAPRQGWGMPPWPPTLRQGCAPPLPPPPSTPPSWSILTLRQGSGEGSSVLPPQVEAATPTRAAARKRVRRRRMASRSSGGLTGTLSARRACGRGRGASGRHRGRRA